MKSKILLLVVSAVITFALFPGIALAENDDLTTEAGGLSAQASSYGQEDITIDDGVYAIYEWTGSAVVPNVTVKDSSGKVLTQGTDYVLEYKLDENTSSDIVSSVSDEGCYRVYAKGVGAYSGTYIRGGADNIFCIAKPEHDISKAQIESPLVYKYNDGESMEDTVNPAVTISGVRLTKDTDYRLFYSKGGWEDSGEYGTHQVWRLGKGMDGKGEYYGAQYFDYAVAASVPTSDATEPDPGSEPNESDPDSDSAPADDSSSTTEQAMHRLYNPNSGEHFYMSDDAECDHLVSLGWNSEGDGWDAPESSNTPVYRMYNPVAGEHHYTPDAEERDNLIAAGWNDEGIGWYSDDARRTPLYRDYNPNAFSNNHNYMANVEEHEMLEAAGWVDEGVAWYGL